MNSQRIFNKLPFVLSVALLCGHSLSGQVSRSDQNARPYHQQDRTQRERRPITFDLEDQEKRKRENKDSQFDDPAGARGFRRLQLQDENGDIPADGLLKAQAHLRLMKTEQLKRLKAQQKGGAIEPLAAGIRPDSWTWLGPGNVGGRILTIVIHPTNPNSMWIGSASGGIWHSTNSGNSWQPVNDFMANLAVSTMVIDPSNSNIMYAGTGEGFGNGDAIQGLGILQSINGGATWNQLFSTNPAAGGDPVCGVGFTPCPPFWLFVNRLAVSPDGRTILAATALATDAIGNTIDNGGIATSSDGGLTWKQRTSNQATDIKFHPTDSTRAIVGELGSVRFSTNRGQSWTSSTFSPAISNGGTAATNGRVELAYAPSNPMIVYAAVNNNNGDIYRSANGGQNFSRVNTGTNFFLGGNSINQGWYDNTIWVNPQDPSFVVVGGIDLWRSTDCGRIRLGQVQCNFTQISRWQDAPALSVHADQHVIVSPPGFNNNVNNSRGVYFGNDGGIYHAADISTVAQTSGWTSFNANLGITQFYGVAGNANSGVIIGGTQDNSTIIYPCIGCPANGSTDWSTVISSGGDGGFCAADPTDANYFYNEYANLRISRSTDGGYSVSRIDNGITDATCTPPPGGTCTPPANFIAPFILDPNDPNTMLAGGVSLWRSTNVKDATPNWTPIKAPTGAIGSNCPACISAIAVSPSTSSFIVVGHNDGSIFRTLNGTDLTPAWSPINTGLPGRRMVTRLVIDDTRSPNWIYATFGGFSADNVYRSTDLGNTWTDITGAGVTGLPNVPVRTLVYHPTNSNLLYVGTEVGIFTSNNAGATWDLPQDGPANVSVDDLSWLGGDLLAATHGRGLYRASGGVYVRCGPEPPFEDGSISFPFNTVAEAVNATTRYRPIWIFPGTCNETFTNATRINKGLELRSTIGGTVIIGRP